MPFFSFFKVVLSRVFPKNMSFFCLFVNGVTGVILYSLLSCFICLQSFSMLLQVAVVP